MFLIKNLFKSSVSNAVKPKRVVVTGAAGNIAYALAYRIASG
jgi:short-subunit dehydrogenase